MKVKALKKLTFNTSRGQVTVEPGQICKPAAPELLIEAGVAVPIADSLDSNDPELIGVLRMPMSQFKKDAYLIRVRCRHLNNEDIFIASSEKQAEIGRSEGLICYLPDELLHLIKGQATPEEVRAVHMVKKELGGTLIEAREITELKPAKKKGVR